MSKTVDLYRDGYELKEISKECSLTEEEIVDELRLYKQSCMIMRGQKFRFEENFKRLIIDRYINCESSSSYNISNELGIGTSTITKYLKESGIELGRGSTKPKNYKIIHWSTFEVCPDCIKAKNVRRLNIHFKESEERPEEHSFCIKCNTEWYKEKEEVRKVLWHMIQ